MPLDRRGGVTLEPRPSPAEHLREESGDRVGVGYTKAGGGGARADLHADVGSAEHGERILIGEVVADEEGSFGTDLLADAGESRALVGVDKRELDDHLPVLGGDAGLGCRDLQDLLHGRRRGVGIGLAVVESDARRLALDDRPRSPARDLVEVLDHAASRRADLVGQILGETGLELRAVRADEVHLRRQPAESGQVAQ